jgi:hypothetical protein
LTAFAAKQARQVVRARIKESRPALESQ